MLTTSKPSSTSTRPTPPAPLYSPRRVLIAKRSWPSPVPVGRTLARALVGAAGTQLGLRLAGCTTRWLGPLQVSAGLALARNGGVQIDVPPLGTATIRSHRGPLRITAIATGVDPSRARGLLPAAGKIP